MTAPQIVVNGGSPGVKAAVSASAAWSATLDSTAGVRSTTWEVISTDETTSTASYTLVQSGSVGQTVSSTALSAGTALLLKATINGGLGADGEPDPDNTTATVKIGVLTSAGLWVGVAGEEMEHDATFGSTEIINAGVRLASTLAPSGIAVHIVKAATAAALPANTRTGNVLTASANGAFPAIDTSATISVGDYFLAQSEGGGASHVNNGVYSLTTAGSGGSPWTATRATYFNESGELIQGTRFTVQQGDTHGGTERYLVTSGATINVTALEFSGFGGAPVNAQYLVRTANANLTSETAIDAITSTVDYASTTVTPLSSSRGAAAGTVQEVLGVTREVTAAGAGTTGTGARIAFRTRDGAGTPALSVIATERAELTAVAGANLSAKRVWANVNVGALTDWMTLGEAGGIRLHAYTTEGFLSTTAALTGIVATIQPRVLCDGSTDITPNARNIQALSTTLNFQHLSDLPIGITRGDAATSQVLDALMLTGFSTGGPSDIGIGAGLLFGGWDVDGFGPADGVYIGRVSAKMTNVTNGAHAATLLFHAATAGALAEVATLTGAGIWAVTGGFIGPSWDRASAGALAIGAATATSVAITPATSITGALTVGSSIDRIAAGALSIGGATATSVAITPATSISGALTVGSRVDRMTAGALLIGDTTATSVAICDQVTITNTGAQTHTLDSSATTRHQWGTAGTRYVDRVSTVFTSDSSAGYETALSYTLPDNCVAEVVVWATAINTSTGDAAGYGKRRTVKRFSGGGATSVGVERDLGADNEDVAAYTLRTGVTGNTVYVEVDSDTAAAKWGIDLEVHITTTSA